MSRANISRWFAVLVATVAGVSLAGPLATKTSGTSTIPIEPSALASECQQFLKLPADAQGDAMAWNMRLSIAACRQPGIVLSPVGDPEKFHDMVTSLEHAADPSIQIYRDAMERGSTPVRLVAAYGLGMTYVNIMVRARSLIYVVDNGTYGGTGYGGTRYLARLHELHRSLEPWLGTERDGALAAFADVARTANKFPAVVGLNEVTMFAFKDAANQAALLR